MEELYEGSPSPVTVTLTGSKFSVSSHGRRAAALALAASDLEHRPRPVLCVTNHGEQTEGEGTLSRAQGPAGDIHQARDGSTHTGWT